MLSALVLCPLHPDQRPVSSEAVVRTLGALVPAIVDGIVRDVVLVAAQANRDLQHIADHAGCALITAPSSDLPMQQGLMQEGLIQEGLIQEGLIQEGLRALRGSHVFILRAGLIPETGFADELADCLADHIPSALMREQPQSFLQRLLPQLAPIGGLLAEKQALLRKAQHIGESVDLRVLARSMGPVPTLRARLRRAG